MQTLRRTAALRRELTAADRIPYTAHVAPTVVRTVLGDYVQVLRLAGGSFESNDDADINNWHERLNVLWRNIAAPHVALWTQVVRRRAGMPPGTQVPATPGASRRFADSLHAKYRDRLANETLMMNEIYLAVVYRPTSSVATGVASKVLAKMQRGGSRHGLADALDACEKIGADAGGLAGPV